MVESAENIMSADMTGEKVDTPEVNLHSREDESFLNVVAADLDSFCHRAEFPSKIEDGSLNGGVLIFPSVDPKHRRLIHSLITQRYPSLAHASIGVEPDRRPVAIYRDFLFKIVLPTRFREVKLTSGTIRHSEFTFCLALLEACKDCAEAKRFIEKLYSFRLSEQRLSPTKDDSNLHASRNDSGLTKNGGYEPYVPRPMRLLQEKQRSVGDNSVSSSSSNSSLPNTRTRTMTVSVDALNQDLKDKLRISSFDDESNTSETEIPAEGSKKSSLPNRLPPLVSKALAEARASTGNIKDQAPKCQRKSSLSSYNPGGNNPNVLSIRILGDFVGPFANVIHIPQDRYLAFRSNPPPLDYDALQHVLEISGFPNDWRGADLQRILPIGTFIHWVDDTHILAVFKSPADAKAFSAPPEVCISIEVLSMRSASIESKFKAYRIMDDLLSRLRKPQTSSTVVRRVLNHHLRLGLPTKQQSQRASTAAVVGNASSNNITPSGSALVSEAARVT